MRIPALFSVGKEVVGSLSAEEAIQKSGLDFTVSKRTLSFMGLDGQQIPFNNKVGIVRDDTDELLGVASPSYGIMQYEQGFSCLNALVRGENRFVRAGATRNGARAFITAQIGGEWLVDGREEERHVTYLTAKMSHDSSGEFEIFLTFLRQICSNGMKGMVRGRGFSARHSKNILNKTADVAKVLNLIEESQEIYQEQMKSLMRDQVDSTYIQSFIETIMPSPDKEISTRLQNNRDALKGLILRGTGTYGRTKHDIIHGVTEYVDHVMNGRITEKRMGSSTEEEIVAEQRWERCIEGSGEALKARTLELLLN
jgi:phage/plasmid-like protein (TIGR03299 family)